MCVSLMPMSGKIDNVCFICPDTLAAGGDRVTTENWDNVNSDINSPVLPPPPHLLKEIQSKKVAVYMENSKMNYKKTNSKLRNHD